MSFIQLNTQNLPELVVSSKQSNIFNRHQNFSNASKTPQMKKQMKSLTKIPIESAAQMQGLKLDQENSRKNEQLLLNQRGFSTPKVLKTFNAISFKISQSTVNSINKNNVKSKLLKKQTTLNFDDLNQKQQSNCFSSFTDFCEKQDNICKSPGDTQSQTTSDSGNSDKSPISQQQFEAKPQKPISIARLKSYKDINDAHNRHMEQKEFTISNLQNQSQKCEQDLKSKNEHIESQNKLINNLQNTIKKLTEQLEDAEDNVNKTHKQNTIIRSEINEQRKEAPEFQTLLDENMFLKQQCNQIQRSKKAQEAEFNEYKNLQNSIHNWNAIKTILNPTAEMYEEFIISRLSDYKQRREEHTQLTTQHQELKSKFQILKEDYDRLEQEKRIQKATIEMQECRIESLKENDGYSKMFSRLTGITLDGVEQDLLNLYKLSKIQTLNNSSETQQLQATEALKSLDTLNLLVNNMKGNQTSLEIKLNTIEKKLQNQYNSVEKYKFVEEYDELERKARALLQCNKCSSTLYKSITHVPCGHSFCMDCHEERKQKIELNDSIPSDQKQSRLCSCSMCGQDKQGNFIYKNKQMSEITSLYKHIVQQKDMIKLLLSRY